MAYIATLTPKKEYPKPADGEYLAICNKLIDLGTHKNSYGNMQASIVLGFEIHGENLISGESAYMEDGKPFVVDSQFNPYFGTAQKASNFRKFLEGWRGKAFTPEELEGFDIENLLGKACRLTLVTRKNEDGSEGYQNITDAKPVYKGAIIPAQANSSQVFILPSRAPWNQEVFDKLPEFRRNKIKDSQEYREHFGSNHKPVTQASTPVDVGSNHFAPGYDAYLADLNG